ncbi:CLAVATA3/ESR (CLE)-related protein 41-like [Magnolia sinica]|uniref:CLAVATA3/ESR (CLE)-related protein 41-like n=1 Tax=Magnolia sinica TaxID=86752 RepID=UPI0026591F45|nr:CLAVATA3/ESR (CLE)-related protein 41-like [Magnolia sinica]
MASDNESFTKTQSFRFGLLLLLLLLLVHPTDQLNISMPSISVRKLLSPTSQSAKLHPQATPSRQFESSAHEVPSGPNPICNRFLHGLDNGAHMERWSKNLKRQYYRCCVQELVIQ